MKRKNKILPLVLMGLITLSGCNSNNTPVNPDINNNDKDDDNKDDNIPTHTHSFSKSWTYDDNSHWHDSTCEHELKNDEGEHEFENGICKVCGYEYYSKFPEMQNFRYKVEGNEVILIGIKDETITDIIIPDLFTAIGSSAFFSRDFYTNEGRTINSIVIPSSIKSIEDRAFKNVTFNSSVIIPDSVTSLGEECFADAKFNSSFEMPDSITSLGTKCFQGCEFSSDVTLSNGLTTLGERCFDNAIFNGKITIPDSVITIGVHCFDDVKFNSDFVLSSNLTTIGDNCFDGATFTKEFVMPDSVTSIGEACFYYASLPSIKLSNNLKEIPDQCFYNTIMNDLDFISEIDTFKIVIPDSVKRIGYEAFAYSFNKKNHALWYSYSILGEVECGKNLKVIAENAFEECIGLKEIKLNDGLEMIGKKAFYNNTSLKEFSIPDTVTNIESYAFENCTNLENIKLSSGLKKLEDALFFNCKKINVLDIPEGVEVIGKYLFNSYNPKKVIIPSTIKEINTNFECEVYYNGTLTEWFKLIEGDNINTFYDATNKFMKDDNDNYYNFYNQTDIVIPDGFTEINRKMMNTFAKKENYYSTYPGFAHVKSITIPKSVKKIVGNCIPCLTIYYEGSLKEWMEIERPVGDIYYSNYADINLYVKENGEYVNSKTLNLPDDITEIKPYQFLRYRVNSKLVIPSNIKVIGKKAFYDAKETNYLKITNPSIKIESEAFAHLSSGIKTLEIDNPDGIIMDIDSSAFEYAFYNLNLIYNGTKESFEANTSLRKALKWFSSNTVVVSFPDGEKIKL